MINDLKYVNEILVWAFFTEDVKTGIVRANIRSRGPEIKDICVKYGGGGHKYASGIRMNDFSKMDDIINELNELSIKYINENKM